ASGHRCCPSNPQSREGPPAPITRSTRVFKTPPAENLRRSAMPTKTTDLFEVEHIEYVADRSVDEVASVLEEATGDVTDPKHASEVASAKDPDDFEARARWFEADSGFMRFLTLNDRGFLTLMDITGNSDRGKPGFPTGF